MAKGSLRWLGHAFFEFVTAEGKVVLLDPWTSDGGNPSCPLTTDQVGAADLVLATHDHFDHISSALPICNRTGAMLGAQVQTLGRLVGEGLAQDKAVNHGMGFNPGGGADLGWVKVVATPAFHSSDSGSPLGLVVRAADGTTIYHAGDTGIFGDMELIARLYSPEVVILPIGGVFTMDPAQAAEAVALMNPPKVVPCHFASFPVLVETADEFAALCREKAPRTQVAVLTPGESLPLG